MMPKFIQGIGFAILLATVQGFPATPDEAPPGSAGNHAAVQSGQFFLTNNDNYGIQITPYSSSSTLEEDDEKEDLPKPQAQKIEKGSGEAKKEDGVKSGNELGQQEDIYCAGCSPLKKMEDAQNQQLKFQSGHFRPRPQAQAVPVLQPFTTGYSYNSNLQWQGPIRQQNPPQNQWGWASPQRQRQNQWGQQVSPSPQSQWGYMSQAPQQQQEPQMTYNVDPATMQHLQINNEDGRYSFGYSAPDSSRQEQRTADGRVRGSYGYTDPTGQMVQIQYQASPNEGFQAFGPTIPMQNYLPPPPAVQAPQPVQDTPEVQAARAQFFEAYNQQLALIQRTRDEALARQDTVEEQEQETPAEEETTNADAAEKDPNDGKITKVDSANAETTKQPEKKTPTKEKLGSSKEDFMTLPEPIAAPDSNTLPQAAEKPEDDELENDAVVINRDDQEPSGVPEAVNLPKNDEKEKAPEEEIKQDPPSPAYSYSISFGGHGQGQGQGQAQVQIPQNHLQPPPQPFAIGYQSSSTPYNTQPAPQPYTYNSQSQSQSQYPVSVPVGPSYQLSHMVGGNAPYQQPLGYQQYQQPQTQQNWQIPMMQPQSQAYAQHQQQQPMMHEASNNAQSTSTSPGYFYYVSVGGNQQEQPNYITASNLFQSSFPTSLKARLVGAIPQDARHDAQVPHQNIAMVQNDLGAKSTPPVYLDVDPSKIMQGYNSDPNAEKKGQPVTIVGFIPGALVSLRDGSYVSVNSGAVAYSADNGNGNGGTTVQIQTPRENGGHNIPLFIFKQ